MTSAQNTTGVPIGHTIIDNGEDIAVLFPLLPFIETVEPDLDEGRIDIRTAGCTAFIGNLSQRVISVMRTRGLLLVGVDALLRPAFEHEIQAVH